MLHKDPNVVFTSSDGHTELSDITTYLPRGSAVKPTRQETQVRSLAGEDHPREEKSNPLQYSCLEKTHGQRSLAGYRPWDLKKE